MKLVCANEAIFHDLEAQWRGQHAKYEDDFDEYLSSYREHSRKVIAGSYPNYFVYVLDKGLK